MKKATTCLLRALTSERERRPIPPIFYVDNEVHESQKDIGHPSSSKNKRRRPVKVEIEFYTVIQLHSQHII